MSNLDLTILIPTKDRVEILFNTLKFYKNFNYNGSILIFDSSSSKNSNILKKKISKINLGFKLEIVNILALPFGTISIMREKIKTKYLVFSGDDDYFIPSNLIYFVYYLDNNKSFFGVNGYAVQLSKSDNKKIFQDIQPYFLKESIEEKAVLRLKSLLQDYKVPLFSIVKTKDFKKLIKLIPTGSKANKLPRMIVDEILVSCLYVMSGKIKFLEKDLLIRVGHATNTRLKPLNLIDKRTIEDTKKFLNLTLESFCTKMNENNFCSISKILDDYFQIISKSTRTTKFFILQNIKSFIFKYLKNYKFLNGLVFKYYKFKIIDKIHTLEKNNYLLDKRLFIQIYLYINTY